MNIRVEFPLPYKMPVSFEGQIVSSYEGHADYRLEFAHETYDYRLIDEEEVLQGEVCTAIIDYSPIEKSETEQDRSEIFRFAVVNSLAYLNHFIDGLRFVQQIHYISNIAISDLPSVIYLNYNEEKYGYVTSPLRELQDEYMATKDDIGEVLKYTGMWDRHPEINIVDKFFINALHYLYREEFIFTVFQLQTSFEVFIRNSYKVILLAQNYSDGDVQKKLKTPFRNLIEHNLAKELNENLDFIQNAIVHNWYEKLYKLRNEIVHSGRTFITGEMAYEAHDAYINVRDYISDLMVRESYLNKEGKLDLVIFEKNIKGTINEEEVRKRLIDKGFMDPKLPIIKR